MQFRRSLKEDGWKMIDPKAKLLERETYEHIVELYVEIAEELERLIDR